MERFLLNSVWITSLFSIGHVSSVMIRNYPTNVTVLKGDNAVFTCNVIEQRRGQYVFWKKVTEMGFTDVLTYNNNTLNATKYVVRDSYTLTIRDVDVNDEAFYECQAGIDRARAALAVAVLGENMTLYWETPAPLEPNSLVNLTCHVIHSRPPADIKWFFGNIEFTSSSSTCQQTFNIDGYGDSTSTLLVDTGSMTDDVPYRCVAHMPNLAVSHEEVIFVSRFARYTSGYQHVMTMAVYIQVFILPLLFYCL